VLDELNMATLKSIMLATFRLDNPGLATASGNGKLNRKNRLLAHKLVNMCCRAILKMQQDKSTKQPSGNNNNNEGKEEKQQQAIKLDSDERCVPFYTMLRKFLELKSSGHNSDDDEDEEEDEPSSSTGRKRKQSSDSFTTNLSALFTELIVQQLYMLLMECAPYHTLQWLNSIVQRHASVHAWCLENLEWWARALLIEHRHTHVRYSAAVVIKQLVPNLPFRAFFNHNRNILLPFNPVAQQSVEDIEDSEMNFNFDSVECKTVSFFFCAKEKHKQKIIIIFNKSGKFK
jgi:hypothetical protein